MPSRHNLRQHQFSPKAAAMMDSPRQLVVTLLHLATVFAISSFPVPNAVAQSALANTQLPGARIGIEGQTVLVHLQPNFAGKSVELPRLAAPVRSLAWQGESADARSSLKLQPELTTWKLTWDAAPAAGGVIELQLDAAPLLIAECKPIEANGDGSLYLPAHMATTTGDKIRYEPQPFKNTVGYWAGMQNSASWSLKIAKAGKFNVAILQGCGAGNGGSTAELTLHSAASPDNAAAELQFEVQDTGHFQNFVWRHLGEINLTEASEYQLRVSPKNIKRGALMDVRAVHLIRLP